MRIAKEYSTASTAVFKLFKLKHPEVDITYSQWANIIYTFNYAMRDKILETGEKLSIPYGFGEIYICKFKPKRTKEINGQEIIALPVDWKRTKEVGYKVYFLNVHTEGFKFRVKWDRTNARFKGAYIWNFKPSRVTSRLINHYIKKGFQDKYQEW